MSLLDRLRGRVAVPALAPEPVAAAPAPGTAGTVARAVPAAAQHWRGLGPTALVTATAPSVADPRHGAGHALAWQQPPPRLTHAGAGGPTGLVSSMATVLQGGLGVLAAAAAPGSDEPLELPLAVPAPLVEDAPAAPRAAEPLAPLRRLAAAPEPSFAPLVTPAPAVALDLPSAGATAAAPVAPVAEPTSPPVPDVPVGFDGPGLRLVRRPPRAAAPEPPTSTPQAVDELALPLAAVAPVPAEPVPSAPDRTPLDPRPLPVASAPAPQVVEVPGPVVPRTTEPTPPAAAAAAAATAPPTLPLATRAPAAGAATAPDRPLLGRTPLSLPPALQLAALPQPASEQSAAGLALLAPLAVVEPGRPRATAAGASSEGVTDLLRAPLPPGATDSGPALARAVGQTLEPAAAPARPVPAAEATSLLGRLFRGAPAAEPAPAEPARRPADDDGRSPAAARPAPAEDLPLPLRSTAAWQPDPMSPPPAITAPALAGSTAPALRLLPSVAAPLAPGRPLPGRDVAPSAAGAAAAARALPELVPSPGRAPLLGAVPGPAGTPVPMSLPAEPPPFLGLSGPAPALAEPAPATTRPVLSAVADALPLARTPMTALAEVRAGGSASRPGEAPPLSGPALLAAGLAEAEAEVDAVRPPEPVPGSTAEGPSDAPAATATPAAATPPPSVGAMADEIYAEVRSRLRDELLLARERSATLADL